MAGPRNMDISYPEVRWSYMRATQGWAGLQHHSLVHSTLTISPPKEEGRLINRPHHLLIDVKQASWFCLRERGAESLGGRVSWHYGNIYQLAGPHQTIRLPSNISISHLTVFDLWISADYEIRLFGDPLSTGDGITPVTKLQIDVSMVGSSSGISLGKNHFYPDIVGGMLLGEAVGVEVTSTGGRWQITNISCGNCNVKIHLSIKTPR